MDWRFNEFPNEGCHCLYVTCVELMSLPEKPEVVGEMLIDVILTSHSHIDQVHTHDDIIDNISYTTQSQDRLADWINAVGLLLSNLPEAYWTGLHNKLEQAMLSSTLKS